MPRNSKQERERERAGDAKMFRAWKKFHRDEREAALTAYGTTLGELFRMFANIECVHPAQLIGFINAIDWGSIDYETRLTVLHEVNSAIVRWRERHGLSPLDDPLWDAPPNAFQVIRKIITESPAPSQERPARRGPYPGASHEQ
jgi:hypothetical protein